MERVLSALADPTRRRILDLLAESDGGTATALATRLPISRQAVVKHLAVLDRADLVTGRQSGREVRYRVRPEGLEGTARWMNGLAAQWDRRLAAIKLLAESDVPDEPPHAGPAAPPEASRPGDDV
ncbi:ArsR/SmtB family transcription factor [Yinghuangia seranimata]|uniref:ArsR/SmtB family transcription factor n=1 Tax=Yinghuangia seranimata TaxID=408067 RepID=UPI00248CE94D|nr:metalloregulator ArsR/SmtB family transcription factor [Yinghuangia seranimata]MDI2125555.1 metalloregulator ArsR/SmtB family transcription factor [Yinghuangia seranimata]